MVSILNTISSLLEGSFVLFTALNLACGARNPVLRTTTGQVNGMVQNVDGTAVEVFYGVPYARPPLGMYRFGHSSPHPGWKTPIDGTVKPPVCMQVNDTTYDAIDGAAMWEPDTEMSEDCLFLNVWRPTVRKAGPLRIMVWIHGGGFWTGSAVLDAYEGSQIAARQNVILVTIAYRLGAFGFVHINGKFQGNYGLTDQVFALQFIKINAQNLGGSKNDITLFGEGAGAVSVGFHLMSRVSQNNFNNAIMQSGSPLADWAIVDKESASKKSAKAIDSLGCDTSSDNIMEFFKCMRTLGSVEFTNAFAKLRSQRFLLPVGPIIDGFMFNKPIKDTFSEIKRTNIIIGVNKNKGFLAGMHGFEETFAEAVKNQGKFQSKTAFRQMFLDLARNDDKFQKKVMKEYHRESKAKENRRLEMIDAAIGDILYKCPTLDFAREYTKLGGKVYMYSFEDRFTSNLYPEYMDVPHRSEIEVVFGAPLKKDSSNTAEETELTQKVMGLWSSFAKTGTPTYNGVSWPTFTVDNQEYIQIGSNSISTANSFRQKTCPLWEGNYTGNLKDSQAFTRARFGASVSGG